MLVRPFKWRRQIFFWPRNPGKILDKFWIASQWIWILDHCFSISLFTHCGHDHGNGLLHEVLVSNLQWLVQILNIQSISTFTKNHRWKTFITKVKITKENKRLFYEELATLYIIHSYSFFQIHDLFWDDVSKLNFVRTSFHSDYTNRASHRNAV